MLQQRLIKCFLVSITILLMLGCGSESDKSVTDTLAPVITIDGDNPISVDEGSTYTDAGASAIDAVDGIVNVTSMSTVDTTTVGEYTVTYSATDTSANTATATRIVNVIAVNTDFRAVEGVIRNYKTGLAVAGVDVSVGSRTVTSDANGAYLLQVDGNPGDRIVVGISGDGYSSTSKIVSMGTEVNARMLLNVDVLPVAFRETFDSTQDFTAQVADSPANVAIEANSLVNANGDTVTGDITAELTPIDPALDISLMPGNMTISSGDPIASYGAMTVTFTDATGNPLNLATGETSTIRIPVSNRGTATVPNSIPLFYFDATEGFWVEEGTATLSSDGTYYEGTVSHFSTWNADYLYESISIQGCVQNEDGTKIVNALVEMEGFNYNGMASTYTDSNGNFSVNAMKNGISLVFSSTSEKVSNTVKVGDDESTATSITLEDCLIVGDVPLTARLTWGENPRDLDTHIIGPNSYHIWYASQGHLGIEPFARLDVDDTSSYGPEVFTALRFPEAGTYHYAVYHYSGSSTISASPARVELILNGERKVFIPSAGQVNESWWNVFDIVVDADGNISIVPINTWSSDTPTSSQKLNRVTMPLKV
ncbi:MAG: Unknown protein [uncultured Sulfurovum sp.]|uniref:Pesticidal crystal protein Cry22Aa Ig-like domain-containing protein n=1 Tax=uncultured Sulfurovum sp. TaxID=269237 RepID=A0A6S6SVZ3_9BACT|nr:MAG: Unknown protein [uncultured Sulfurovum sp.]